MDPKAEKIALFRNGLIVPPVVQVMPSGEMTHDARDIPAHPHELQRSLKTSAGPAK